MKVSPYPGEESYGVAYDFEGPVRNIFTTLVVRLAHAKEFKSNEFFRDAATYTAGDKQICIVKLDENKTLIRLLVTEIIFNKVKNEKHLVIRCLYSFTRESDNNIWKEDWKFVEQLRDKKQCTCISFETGNERVCEIGRALGFREKHRHFVLEEKPNGR